MALSADRARDYSDSGSFPSVPVAASAVIYNGSIVVQDTTGGAHTAGYGFAATLNANNVVVGVAIEAKTGTAADGGVSVMVRRDEYVWLTNSAVNPVTLADVGKDCYIEDDEKVRTYVAGGVNVPVGQVLDVDSAKGVQVIVTGKPQAVNAPGAFAVGGNLSVGGDITGTGATLIATTTGDLTLDSPDDDVIVELGDAAGAKKFKILDSADAEVFAVDSNGEVEMVAGVQVLGAGALGVTATAAALTLTATDVVAKLGDAAGANKFAVQTSAAAEVASIDSQGDIAGRQGAFTGAVTSAGYGPVAGQDLAITAAAGKNVILTLGDAGGANTLTIDALGGADMAVLTSLGVLTVAAGVTITAGAMTSPTFTSAAGTDPQIVAPANQDIDATLGDAAGANALRVKALGGADMLVLTSLGAMTLTAGLTAAGVTVTAGVVTSPTYTSGAGTDPQIVAPANQDIDVILGDAAGADVLRIKALGGADMVTIGSAGDVTVDAAGSMTCPSYTSAAGSDPQIVAPAGQDIDVILGDAAGANALRVKALGGADMLVLTSLGAMTSSGAMTIGPPTAALLTIQGAAGSDIMVDCADGGITVQLGDNGGVEEFIVEDSTGANQFVVDSDGNVTTTGTLGVTGLITATVGMVVGAAQAITGAGAMTIGPPTAADLTLQGAAGGDVVVDCADGGLRIQLGDAGGVEMITIEDSAGLDQWTFDSDGMLRLRNQAANAGVIGRAASANMGGVPLQAEMVAAFGAGVNGQMGVIGDTAGGGVSYLCWFDSTAGAGGGWFHAVGVLGL